MNGQLEEEKIQSRVHTKDISKLPFATASNRGGDGHTVDVELAVGWYPPF